MVSRRDFLKGMGLIAGGIAGGTLLEMLRLYTPPKPDATEKHLDDNVTITTEVIATLTPEITPPYKLYAPTATKEEFEFFNSALDSAWGIVKDVYGMEPSEQIMVYITKGKQGYGLAPKSKVIVDLNVPVSDSGSYPILDFLADQKKERGIKHELAHRFNETLFPTKNNIEPWYNTFDEGSAKYASGEVEAAKGSGVDLRKDDGSWESVVGVDAIMNRLISNPNQFWERKASIGNNPPGHLTGLYLFWSLEHEGLTPEKQTVALQKLAEYYKEPGAKTNKEMIQSAYEIALGKNLNYLFNDWLAPGINRFYVTPTPTPTPR